MSAEETPPGRAGQAADEERAPLFGRWSAWYGLIIAELIGVILICGWLAARNG